MINTKHLVRSRLDYAPGNYHSSAAWRFRIIYINGTKPNISLVQLCFPRCCYCIISLEQLISSHNWKTNLIFLSLLRRASELTINKITKEGKIHVKWIYYHYGWDCCVDGTSFPLIYAVPQVGGSHRSLKLQIMWFGRILAQLKNRM